MKRTMHGRVLTAALVAAAALPMSGGDILMNRSVNGYRGIWYSNQPTGDEYVYKYSGGLGTYCAKHIPMAVYAPAVRTTFFVYGGVRVDDPGGRATLIEMIGSYDHRTGLLGRPVALIDKGTTDAHDNPVLSLDEEGRLWVFASSHGTARPSYILRSRRPHDISEFDIVCETNFSYPQPWHIPGKGFLFLHTVYRGGRALHWSVSPDGVAWSEPSLLSLVDEGHYQVSWPRGERVGTAFNFHPKGLGLNHRTNLYYIETGDMGATWRCADGAPIPVPLRSRDDARPALVHDYEAEGLKVYMKDIAYDGRGRPAILHLVSRGWEPGPGKGPREWRIAYWTGETWRLPTVTVSDNNYDTGSLHIEADGLWRVLGPTETGPQPYNPGGEIAVWTSRDEGETWTRTRQVTAGSPYNHTYVRKPVNAHPDFYAYWADGHGRQPSESRLYFCNRDGDRAFRMPASMDSASAQPEPLPPTAPTP